MKRVLCAAAGFGLFLFVTLPIFLMSGPADTDEASSGGGEANGGLLSDVVPAIYRGIITRAGSICPTITPAVVAAQIEAESNWNPNSHSAVGATGISQFMPATWASKGKDGDGDGRADINNPFDAIYSQGMYDCELASSVIALKAAKSVSGDDLDLTLAAYNSGLGNVTKHRGVPPFKETRGYVAKIRAKIADYDGGPLDGGGAPGNVQSAIDWATAIANDDSHRYVLGASGPHYDCSGLSQAFMARLGKSLPHRANEQAKLGRPVSEAQAKPGDLIFWSHNGGGHYYHVAIYIGNGRMISADNERMGINVEQIYWKEQTSFRTYV